MDGLADTIVMGFDRAVDDSTWNPALVDIPFTGAAGAVVLGGIAEDQPNDAVLAFALTGVEAPVDMFGEIALSAGAISDTFGLPIVAQSRFASLEPRRYITSADFVGDGTVSIQFSRPIANPWGARGSLLRAGDIGQFDADTMVDPQPDGSGILGPFPGGTVLQDECGGLSVKPFSFLGGGGGDWHSDGARLVDLADTEQFIVPTIRVPEGCTSPPMLPVADLMVTQTASSESPMLGEAVIHVTQITNDGPDGTGPFVLEIMLPESADVLSADATIGACDQVPIMGMLECQSELAGGEIGTYTLEVLYNDFGQQSYCTEVMGEFIDDTPEGQVCTEITVVQGFDLVVTKTADADPVGRGRNITYSIEVSNKGPGDAPDVTLIDTVDPRTPILLVDGEGCDIPAETVTCYLGLISAGAPPIEIIIVVQVPDDLPEPQLVENTATVESTGSGELNPGDNEVTISTLVLPAADLMVTQTSSTESPMVGEPVTHVTQVTNDGPHGTDPFVLGIMLPESAAVLSAEATIGSCDQVPTMGELECQSNLSDGETGTYTLVVVYNDFGQQSYCTEVMGEFIDDTPEGQVCTEIDAHGLQVTKEESLIPDPSVKNQTLFYLITIRNNGPNTVTGITLTDDFSGAQIFMGSSKPDQGTCVVRQSVPGADCDLGDLEPDDKVLVSIRAIAKEIGTVTNTATVRADEDIEVVATETTAIVERDEDIPGSNTKSYPERNSATNPMDNGSSDGGVNLLGQSPCSRNPTPSCPNMAQSVGDPLYLHSGEIFLFEEDLRIPSRGFDFVFSRKYRSGVTFEGPLGHNWDHNYNRKLVEVTEGNLATIPSSGLHEFPAVGDVVRVDGFLRADLYQKKPDDTYIAPQASIPVFPRSPTTASSCTTIEEMPTFMGQTVGW